MEEQMNSITQQINNLAQQLNTIVEKFSTLESNSVTKNDLSEQIKGVTNELVSLKKEMISKNDIKIEVRTILGKNIVLYVKSTEKISEIKTKIKEKLNIAEDQQSLFLEKQLLNDDSTVAESKIKETSNLYLMKTDDEYLSIASPQEKLFIIDALEKNLNKVIKCLLYNARKDGDDSKTFHRKCDKNEHLLYVIKTTNDIVFAIYIDKPLLSDGNTRTDSLQMVISPAHNFAIKSLNNNATYHCKPDIGAQFHCMQINTPFLSSSCNDIQSCSDFNLPQYPSGNSSYQIKELEVYALKDSGK